MAKACRGPVRRLAEGAGPSSSGLGTASAKPLRSPLWPRAREQPSGPVGWVSCRGAGRGACTWGRGRPPYSLGQGLGRKEGQAWAWCPCRLGPHRWAGSSSLPRMQRTCVSCSPDPTGRAAARGWCGGRSGPCSAAADPREAQAGLGVAGPWGQAPACPSTTGGLQRPAGPPGGRGRCGQAVPPAARQGSPCL